MWPNPQFPSDLVTFAEETLNGKLHFLCSERIILFRYEFDRNRNHNTNFVNEVEMVE